MVYGNIFWEWFQVNKAQQLIEMESSQPIPLEERQGTMQKAESGNQGNRNQYEGWDIPRPGTQHSRRSGKGSVRVATYGLLRAKTV